MDNSTLPIPFGLLISKQRDAAALSLHFSRKLGSKPTDSETAIDEPQPTPYVTVAVCHSVGFSSVTKIGVDFAEENQAAGLSFEMHGVAAELLNVTHCGQMSIAATPSLLHVNGAHFGEFGRLAVCYKGQCSALFDLRECRRFSTSTQHVVESDNELISPQGVAFGHCFSATEGAVDSLVLMNGLYSRGLAIDSCARLHNSSSLKPPCEYYEIPIEPEPGLEQNTYVCGIRPPSNRLNLPFVRKKIAFDSSRLPLPFACYIKAVVPVLKAYMITNIVTAQTSDGIVLSPFSASFVADMGGYCWQGSVSLSPEDFLKLNIDGRAKGEEAVITVTINDEAFVFIAEEYTDNRQFGNKTFTVSGRSTTSRLGASYANNLDGTYHTPMYAQQIAREQLRYLDFNIERWGVADWLIPADVCSLSDKTPMAVIQELAAAAGGFVSSHPSLPKLSIAPRWKTPAWQVATAMPDVSAPASVVVSISGQRSVAARANGVFVWAEHEKGKAADVYRQGTAREPRASAITNSLFTDQPVLQAAGIAALSDTGTHKLETVKLPIAEKYALPRANLGEIWQIAEPSGSWQGVVTGVKLEVSIENDAPVLWQTLTINRYLDS